MPQRQISPYTVLNFNCDRVALTLRGWFLNDAGYRVLNSSNSFEAIKLFSCGKVDAAVLDLDHNRAEVTLIAQEIKRLQPQVITVVVTEGTVQAGDLCELADVLVPKENGPDTLLESLKKALALTEIPDAATRGPRLHQSSPNLIA